MPSVAFSIDGRGAEQGARQFGNAARSIQADARKTAELVREAQKAIDALGKLSVSGGGAGGGSGGAQVINLRTEAIRREQQATRALEADRARSAREQSRADAQLLRSRQQAERAAITALSTLGGENRALAQRIQFEQRLKRAIDAGVISESTALRLRTQANAVFSTTAVNARDLRANMLGLNQSFAALSRTLSVVAFGPLSGVGARLIAVESAARTGGIALAGFALGLGGVVIALSSLIREGVQSERALARIDGVIRATGGAAGLTTGQINELAREIGRNTLASTDDVRDAAAQLLTFRSIAGDTFERTLKSAEDLAELGFGTIQQSTVQLAKALEDPERNLSNLNRTGITFTGAQRDLIVALAESGRLLEAQAKILEVIEGQSEKTAETVGNETLAGSFDTLAENVKESVKELSETLGLLQSIKAIVDAFNSGISFDLKPETAAQAQTLLEETQRRLEASRSGTGPFLGQTAQLEQRVQELRKILADLQKQEDAAKAKSAEEQRLIANERLADAVRKLSDTYDDHAKSARKLKDAEAALNAAVQAGVITQREADALHAKVLQGLNKQDKRDEKRILNLQKEIELSKIRDEFDRRRAEAGFQAKADLALATSTRERALIAEKYRQSLKQIALDEADASGTAEQFNAALGIATQAMEAARTPSEKLAVGVQKIREAFAQLQAAGVGGITQDEIDKAVDGFERASFGIKTFNEAAQEAAGRALQSFSQGFSQAFVDVVTGSKTAAEAFEEFGARAVAAIFDVIAQMLILKAISSALQGAGTTIAGQAKPSAGIGGFLFGLGRSIQPFADGGIVTGPTLGLVGENAPNVKEAVIPLTSANLRELRGNFVVNVNNNAQGVQATVSRTQTPEAEIATIAIEAVSNDSARRGRTFRSIKSGSNLLPQPRRQV